MQMSEENNENNIEIKKSFVDKMLSTSIELFIGSVLFVTVFFIILIQIFSREFAYISYVLNLPISFTPPIWTEEAARWCWVWIVFVMLGCLEKIDGHLKVSFLSEKMSKKVYTIVNIALDILYLLTVALIFKLSFDFLMRNITTVPVTLNITNFWLYVSLPFGLLFVLVRVFFRVYFSIKKLINKQVV